MRKLLVLTLAALLGLAPGVASADVFILATVDKDKDITIEEHIRITKTVTLTVTVDEDAVKAAESQALVNQTNAGNRACTNCDEKQDLLQNSGNSNAGVISINQATGNMNNQGNAVSVAVDFREIPPVVPPAPQQVGIGFAEAQAAVEQNNGIIRLPGVTQILGFPGIELNSENSTFIVLGNTVETVNVLFRNAYIFDSLNSNTGIIHANQSAGHMNNQANALSLAVSLKAGVALSEADLGQVNVANRVFESDITASGTVGINKTALLADSVNGNRGIVGVNQSVGNMANQANVAAVAVAVTLGP
jgi:hypothetical protein